MSLKKAMATGMFLEKKKEDTIEFLANNIAESFQLLANIEPNVAMHVLNQLNEQLNEEIAEEIAESHLNQINAVASKMNLTLDDLEE